MPAWIAGIQVRKDASGNVRVNLDSSTPCWNDAIERSLLEVTEVPPPRIFKGDHEDHEESTYDNLELRVLHGLRGQILFPLWLRLCRVISLQYSSLRRARRRISQ